MQHSQLLFDSKNQQGIFLYYISSGEKINVGKVLKL
jgi:hypothetical protein